jgi:hypothetical protein
MDELMKNDLIKKLYLLQKEKDFDKKIKVNNAINEDLIEPIKEILRYYVDNKIIVRGDVIGLRNILNYIIKTCRVKYGEEKKFERLNRVINRIK